MRLLKVFAVAVALMGCATSTTDRLELPPLKTVAHVDLQRYLGSWYEIAAFPQRFQKDCTGTTATYSLRPDGDIDVVNQCHLETLEGPVKSARGLARVVDPVTNARLEVTFFKPFWGKYWIIDLGPDYAYAVVGHPNRDYLWILSRTPELDDATYQGILERLKAQGYPVERLVKTPQRSGPAAS